MTVEFEGRTLVMTKERPRSITQPGAVVQLGEAEVKDTIAKLDRYTFRDGAKHPKHKARLVKRRTYRKLLLVED